MSIPDINAITTQSTSTTQRRADTHQQKQQLQLQRWLPHHLKTQLQQLLMQSHQQHWQQLLQKMRLRS